MTNLSNIRSSFLDFFKKNNHAEIKSSSLVPHNDPSLLFTNAGMVPFKNVFNGAETLKDRQGNTIDKATSSQKCVRAGGKHNDLENVGYTARHHTFFEMLGNFSFGKYFKEEAILLAWDFLIKELDLPKEKLYFTVFHNDDEAFKIWQKVTGFGEDRILRINSSDNFWAMGETGPCGPCSEIFYDHGEHVSGGLPGTKEQDGDRFVEIWNLVFMQYNQRKNERLDLPKPCIDTGMGLERVAAILQGKYNNYEIDLFQNLIAASREVTGTNKYLNSHKIIADHLRAMSFLIADGVLPSNEGRGYVLRRIMRRAIRHGNILGMRKSFIYKLFPALISEMGKHYAELEQNAALITHTIKTEEEKFRETLDRGLKLLEKETENLKDGSVLDGKVAFRLYDTYGFPLDLTEDILKAKKVTIDQKTFDEEMQQQKSRSKAAWVGSGDEGDEKIWFDIFSEHGNTEFLGYHTLNGRGKVVAFVKDGEITEEVREGDKIILLTNQTPFYAESGGQAGDKGVAKGSNSEIAIYDTKKAVGQLHLHYGKVLKGKLNKKEILELSVVKERREKIKKNHTATHLLHAALQKVLGETVVQKGSLVESDYFRFDFSYNKRVEDGEIQQIELLVNEIIMQNKPIATEIMKMDEAIEKGAKALFGEKYSEEVRVITAGEEGSKYFSCELCGGTHVERTGDIGFFKILKETAIASGIRRIEAVTGETSVKIMNEKQNILYQIGQEFKISEDEVLDKVNGLVKEKKDLQKEIAALKKKNALLNLEQHCEINEVSENISLISAKLEDVPANELRNIAVSLKDKIKIEGVVFIACENDGKVNLVVLMTDALSQKISAVDLIKSASEKMGGKGGGGKPNFAQGGAVNIGGFDEAREEICDKLTNV